MKNKAKINKGFLIPSIILFALCGLFLLIAAFVFVTGAEPDLAMEETEVLDLITKLIVYGIILGVAGTVLICIGASKAKKTNKITIEEIASEKKASVGITERGVGVQTGVKTQTIKEEQEDNRDEKLEQTIARILSANTLPKDAPISQYAMRGNLEFTEEQKTALKKFLNSDTLISNTVCPICGKPMLKEGSELLRTYVTKPTVVGYEYYKNSGQKIRDIYEDRASFSGIATECTCRCRNCGIVAHGVDSIPDNVGSIHARGYSGTGATAIYFGGKFIGIDKSLIFRYNLINYTREQLEEIKDCLSETKLDTSLR